LFVDCPPSVVDEIEKTLTPNARRPDGIDNPFIWHVSLIEELKKVYDAVVWNMRDIIRAREKVL